MADQKISDFDELTSPADVDLLATVDDPAGTPVTKKLSWTNVKAFLKTYFDTLYNKYVHPNHYGEVTSAADGAQTIAADAVTNTKAANMAQNTIKGRISGGTGNPEDLTAANVRTIANVESGADVTDATNVGSVIHGAAAKTTPVDADTIPITDTGASNVLKKVTKGNFLTSNTASVTATSSQVDTSAGTTLNDLDSMSITLTFAVASKVLLTTSVRMKCTGGCKGRIGFTHDGNDSGFTLDTEQQDQFLIVTRTGVVSVGAGSKTFKVRWGTTGAGSGAVEITNRVFSAVSLGAGA